MLPAPVFRVRAPVGEPAALYLFGKVWFPRLCIPVANTLIAAVEYAIQLIPFLFCALYFALSGTFSIHWGGLLVSFGLLLWLAALGLGVGIIVSSATAKYRDLALLIGLFVRFWMYVTPVVYPLSEVPQGLAHTLVLLNPVTPVMECFRYLLFGVGGISAGMILYSLMVTILILFGGLFCFNRIKRSFMDTV